MVVAYAERLLSLPRYSELGNAAMKPGLRGVGHLLAEMGNPHHNFDSVHIAGTNGKGSVASMIASIGQVAGANIGLYTSPHLLHLSERIRLNGTPVSTEWMESALHRYGSLFDRLRPSFFEAMTALSFLFFAESSVDLAIVESGLGGRLDATNILMPKLCVITKIDLDHTQVLGNTLDSITREKAGIIKRGIPVIAATGREHTQEIVCTTARSLNAPWIESGKVIEDCLHTSHDVYPLPKWSCLATPHQAENALLAAQSAEFLFPKTQHAPEIIRTGLSQVRERTGLRARLEILSHSPLTVLDVAHNPAGISSALRYAPQDRPIHLLFSLMKDKDLSGIIHELCACNNLYIYICDLGLQRGYPSRELAKLIKKHDLPIAGVGPVELMWDLAQSQVSKRDTILICGSHFLAEAFLRVYL